MTQKNRFEDLVKDIDDQFKKIEQRNEKLNQITKKEIKPGPTQFKVRAQKIKTEQKIEKENIKGKLKRAAVVFILSHLMIIPAYMNHPTLIPQIFLIASLSLGFICLAVIDYF